jgi:hypothetical protein
MDVDTKYFSGHYDNWRTSRMNGIKKYISPLYFSSKSLLELGCGYADAGNMFSELGAVVTSSDVRIEYLDMVNQKYPHIKTLLHDSNNLNIHEKYDIVLHWGLLYHLSDIETHLEKVSNICNLLLLETEVSDSDCKDFYIRVREFDGYDQAFNTIGIRPSAAYVESVLEENGFQFKLIKDPILNSGIHSYDWDVKNSETWKAGLRRFWICWKNIDSPLIHT